MRVLLVEDDRKLSAAVVKFLEKERITAEPVYSGTDGLDWALAGEYDAVILDVMLPGMDGFAVLRELRKAKAAVPVLMLTARTALEDRLTGLDSGADYYLPKPFESAELVSCLKAITRRGTRAPVMDLRYGDAALDPKDGKLKNTENGQDVKLGAKVFFVFLIIYITIISFFFVFLSIIYIIIVSFFVFISLNLFIIFGFFYNSWL